MNYEFDFMGGLENGFVFQTINRIVYEVKFIPTPYLFDEASPFASHVYEFSILVADNPTDVEPVSGERISPTRTDGKRLVLFEEKLPAFTPLFGWTAHFPTGRVACRRKAALLV